MASLSSSSPTEEPFTVQHIYLSHALTSFLRLTHFTRFFDQQQRLFSSRKSTLDPQQIALCIHSDYFQVLHGAVVSTPTSRSVSQKTRAGHLCQQKLDGGGFWNHVLSDHDGCSIFNGASKSLCLCSPSETSTISPGAKISTVTVSPGIISRDIT